MTANPSKLIDRYNRRVNYLRISVTDRCNLRCLYCMPRAGLPKLAHKDILTYEEILRLANVALGLGVGKIRLTGGEPLLRKGIYELIRRLTVLPGLGEVSLTTNGIYLRNHLEELWSSGIRRLNISLDTLNPANYARITGLDAFQDVWEAIELAKKAGFQPIKINMVVIAGLNDEEVLDFARLSMKEPYHIRFIEYMPFSKNDPEGSLRHIPNALIRDRVKEVGKMIPISRTELDGPAERYRFEGSPGEVGFISPVTNHFCHACNRLRLTAEGHLRLCLLSDRFIDVKGPMRSGASDSDLAKIFLDAASQKPRIHHKLSQTEHPLSVIMSSIGG